MIKLNPFHPPDGTPASPGVARSWRYGNGASTGADIFDPESLFSGGNGEWWETGDLSTLFTDDGATTPVSSDGDPVGAWVGKRGLSTITQSDTGSKPIYNAAENCVRFFEGKGLVHAGYNLSPVAETAHTWFAFFRKTSGNYTGDNCYMGTGRISPGYSLWTGAALMDDDGSKWPFNDTPTMSGHGLDSTAFHSIAMVSAVNDEILGYADGEFGELNNANTTCLASGESLLDFIMGFASATTPEYRPKMFLVINRVLTAGEIANLHAYAEAMP